MFFNRVYQIPQGLKDLLPEDAQKKRAVEDKILSVFESWGFQLINTPTFEYLDTLAQGVSSRLQKDLYKFFDRDGNILALRPEMTTSIARMAATKLNEKPLPLRLSYLGNVFRYDEPQAGIQREFSQAGVELVGIDDPLADAEVIAIAVECLKEAGLRDFIIGVGSTDFLQGMIDNMELTEEEKEKVKDALFHKNLVELREIIAASNLSAKEQEKLYSIPTLRGGKEVLEKAKTIADNPQSQLALEKLGEVMEILEVYGVASVVNIDLGIVRDLSYYTGIVFEGYQPGFGFPLCGGGRYNNLLGQFGYQVPATGFAVGVERIILALEKQNRPAAKGNIDFLVCFQGNRRKEGIQKAKRLRAKGFSVELEITNRSVEEALNYAAAKGIKNIVIITENGMEENHINENISEVKERINKVRGLLAGIH
jgi:ATP phosphoribosyltransferase regulatory subunit